MVRRRRKFLLLMKVKKLLKQKWTAYQKQCAFCFLAFKTVKFFSNRNSPILRLRFLRSYQPNFFSSQATINDSSESIHIGDSSKSHILNEAKYAEPIPSKTTIESKSPLKKLQAQEKSSIKLQSYKSLKENEDKILVPSKGKVRPNYFVAVQITNPIIHEAIRKIQNHIATQNMSYTNCMTSLPSLHITLMVMSIPNKETHERALKALTNVYEEQNCMMCKNPLTLEFHGLGHFKNRVLYAKIKEDESLKRFCSLAENVRKCFTDAEIVSTDEREFNPHLTIAKIDFSKNKQKKLKKFILHFMKISLMIT
ncbi:hypothetical protein CEXT_476871 [Caerostris extrusa]|uniref:A-kinase anchor protein 7-like phosphoesterase domain-containing protein n=1 Tax=Caerostris extrusa TaxID=172846 RepID=A0AAV4P4A2_CAEEX|nr:hypothetical protein CEXT_476871 [Caerostris extrusa]